VAGLRNAGFHSALDAVGLPSPRRVVWNGEINQANTERLVDRCALDQSIRSDLARSGVQVIEGHVITVASAARRHHVTIGQDGKRQVLSAGFLVEARGRAAPLAQTGRLRGVETVSLLQIWRGPPAPPGSLIQSFEDGWIWVAADPAGARYVQLTVDVASSDLPSRQDLARFCREHLFRADRAGVLLDRCDSCNTVNARTSTPILGRNAIGADWIRVGDAAMAVDPLSGNGIFQSLSSALVAPAVINTLLRQPDSAELACRFYQDRLDHLFMRFARTGRDFYRMEGRWPHRPFWAVRQSWPDDEPMHQANDPAAIRVEDRPIVCDGMIQKRPVVITQDQPLGIWRLGNIELAPVILAIAEGRTKVNRPTQLQLQQRFGFKQSDARALHGWLAQHGLA
jgi:flavin-dependent dehydrogenase